MAAENGVDAYLRQQRAIIGRPDSRPSLAAISCPTLVLVGEQDQGTPLALSQEMAAAISGSRLVVVPECGHLSTMERPEAVTKALVEWMQRSWLTSTAARQEHGERLAHDPLQMVAVDRAARVVRCNPAVGCIGQVLHRQQGDRRGDRSQQ
jgi:hypothetical protein